MRKFKFTGDGPVDVPVLELVDVQPGQVVEVDDPAVAEGIDSSGVWEHIPDPKRSKAAKKAAAIRFEGMQGPELVDLPRGTKTHSSTSDEQES